MCVILQTHLGFKTLTHVSNRFGPDLVWTGRLPPAVLTLTTVIFYWTAIRKGYKSCWTGLSHLTLKYEFILVITDTLPVAHIADI